MFGASPQLCTLHLCLSVLRPTCSLCPQPRATEPDPRMVAPVWGCGAKALGAERVGVIFTRFPLLEEGGGGSETGEEGESQSEERGRRGPSLTGSLMRKANVKVRGSERACVTRHSEARRVWDVLLKGSGLGGPG